MGILQIKLADNYSYGPVNAAQNYLERNKVVTLNLPTVENWELLPGLDYSKGFGVAGKTAATATEPAGWIGFGVCFLLNQTTGVWPTANKTFSLLEKDGLITSRQLQLLEDGLITVNEDSKMTPQVYLDSAKHMRFIMNQLNQSDDSNAQFVYEWDLSSIPNLESSKVAVNFAGLTDYPEGKKAPVGAGQSTNYNLPPGVDRPGYYGSVNVWEDGSATSFYSVEVLLERVEEKEEVLEGLKDYFENCASDQIEKLDELRLLIEGDGGDEK